MNAVYLLGNAGRDAEVRTTESGIKVAGFSLATTESYKDGDEWKEMTQWHSVVCWRHLAEKAEKYVKKGSNILIQGKLVTRKYQDKEGKDKYVTEVVAGQMNVFQGFAKEEIGLPKEPVMVGSEAPDTNLPF